MLEAVQVCSDRWYALPASRDSVWEAISTTDDFRRWWPWLLEFDGNDLSVGQCWSCAVSPPLPYVMHFTLDLVAVEPGRMVRANVRGDITGEARLDLLDDGTHCRLHLASDLTPGNAALQLVAMAAKPLVQRGHDWVLDTGARQFVERALRS